MDNNNEFPKLKFGKDQIENDFELKKREIEIKEKDYLLRAKEVEKKEKDKSFISQITSPVGVAVLVAIISLIGTAISSLMNAYQEKLKQQSELILKISDISDTKQKAINMLFFEKGGFISLTDDYIKYLRDIAGLEKNDNIPLPDLISAKDFLKKNNLFKLRVVHDSTGFDYIGYGHNLSRDDLSKGFISIGDKEVDFRNGITEDQAFSLFEQDTKPYRKQVDSLVHVNLSENKRNALYFFAWDMGINAFKMSSVLRLTNEGKFDLVPNSLMLWVKSGGKTNSIVKVHRQQQVDLWNSQ